MLSTNQNPPEHNVSIEAFPGLHWFVIHTKARHEKSIAEDLLSQGIPYLLPYLRTRNPLTRVTTTNPLFSCFLFAASPLEDPAYTTQNIRSFAQRKIVSFLMTDNQPQLRRELSALILEPEDQRSVRIEKGLNQPYANNPTSHPTQNQPIPAQVFRGPLAGLFGEIINMADLALNPTTKPRFAFDLTLMGQTVSLNIDPNYLKIEHFPGTIVHVPEQLAKNKRNLNPRKEASHV